MHIREMVYLSLVDTRIYHYLAADVNPSVKVFEHSCRKEKEQRHLAVVNVSYCGSDVAASRAFN